MKEFLTVPLGPEHKKSNFNCGNEILERYLQNQAKQDVKRRLSACFILPNEANEVKGYYTLSNAGIPRDSLPEELARKLPPSYHSLPVTLLGRLAVSNQFKGEGIGKLLLIDALKRSYLAASSIGSMAVVVDPIDNSAKEFYLHFQFILLPESGKMFLPMQTIAALFEG